MKYTLLFFFLFFSFSCTNTTDEGKAFKVEYNGELKNFMMNGDISAKADLTALKDIDHLYALGALEKLKGEILILDSEPYMTSANGEEVSIQQSFDHKASLLVYASVSKWSTLEVPGTIRTYAELEQYIAQTAKEQGIDNEQPFPFLLEGSFSSIQWHSINWDEEDMDHSHEKHMTSGPNGTLSDREANVLGFYSNSHHAIFTHHTTNMHLHARTKDGQVVGHVDDLDLGVNMILKLPVN